MSNNEHNHNLPNFHAVLDKNGTVKKPSLFRGGQPTAAGFDRLKGDYGVKTVICLRRDDSHWEEQTLKTSGLKFVHLPLPLRLSKMSTEDFPTHVNLFLQAVAEGPKNVFVHSHAGIDRTGLMIAIYRISMEGWRSDEAFAEMESRGYQGFDHQVVLSRFKDNLYDWSSQYADFKSLPASALA